MGLRSTLRQWLLASPPVDEPESAATLPHSTPVGYGDTSRAAGAWPDVGLPSQPTGSADVLEPSPAVPPPPPVAGTLMVGQADQRRPPVDLPSFYRLRPAPPDATALDDFARADHAPYDHAKVREVWEIVGPHADQLIRNFYAELFLRLPEAMRMFPSDMSRQRNDFGRALVQWVMTDDPDAMTAHLHQLGADHRKFDVEPRHYDITGAALLGALKSIARGRWTSEHETAILGSYTRLASAMIDGALLQAHEPPYWGAVVVDHQRVFGDFAVLRIQPDAPYPYEPGQYTTIMLPTHPNEWRQMSIASAPRADNTFDIHVRRVGASGVSAALVAHTQPGRRLRLGPPRGNDLVVKPGTVPGGLLCVASGTGAAPVTAVVESIMAWPEPPNQLYAFVGGRTRDDLFPVTRLNGLIHSSGYWERMQVHGVVSDDPSFGGLRGKVERVVPALKPWAQLGVDVLVAGPSPMIATTVTSLAGRGVPLGRIHFDQYEAVE